MAGLARLAILSWQPNQKAGLPKVWSLWRRSQASSMCHGDSRRSYAWLQGDLPVDDIPACYDL